MAQNDKYLPELMAEKDSIDPSFEHAVRLIKQEIENINNPKADDGPKLPKKDLLDVCGRSRKVECDILVPVEKHPNVNFVGRLIGPGGATMKGIQELTNTRMAVLGRGSIREKDRQRAEELKDKDEKYAHLNYPLHVHISALGPVPQAFVNLGRAAAEIQKLVMIDESENAGFVGGPVGGQGMRGGRGGGMSNSGMRGGRGHGFQRGGRGGGQRGGASGRGASQGTRGTSRGGARGRGGGHGQVSQYGAMAQSNESFNDDFSYDGYGSAAASASTGFETGYEGYEESYDTSYDAAYGNEAGYGDSSFTEDYSSYGQGSFDAYGNGGAVSAAKTTTGYGGQGSFRGKMRGGAGMRGRQKPY